MGSGGWNKGLSKETDPRVANISSAKKGRAPRPSFTHSIEARNHISEGIALKWRDPIYRAKARRGMSLAKIGKRQPEEFARRRTTASLKALQKSPNFFELRCLAHLERLYPGKFQYTGDGSLFINYRSPDAVDLSTRTVAQFNGVYWHLKIRGLAITEENKRIVEQFEAEPFIQAGYRVIFLWEDEI